MEKKLRVGFASIEDAASVRSWSGIPANILRVLRGRTDVEVELISPMGERFKMLYAPMKLAAQRSGEPFDWKREPGSLMFFASRVASDFRSKHLDVIFSTSSIPGTRLKPEVPVVFWTDANFHVMEGYYRTNQTPRTLAKGRRQEEMALSKARYACYASEWAVEGARPFAGEGRVKVLPFGPNLEIGHTRADAESWIAERRTARPAACNLLLVGVEWERKGVAIAVEAARLMNEAGIATTLRVVGCTPPGPVPSFVEILGFISKREPEGYKRLVDLYRTSDIFILPSRAEAFGIVAAEAAAFGLPLLVAETGGLTETVRNGETGFTLPLSDTGAQFAEKAKVVLADYARFSMNAYADYENRMNWEASVDRLVGLMRQAAAE